MNEKTFGIDYVDWDEINVPRSARVAWTHACGLHVYSMAAALWEEPDHDWRSVFADRWAALYTIFNYGVQSPIEEIMAGWLVWLDGQFFGLPQACHEPWFEEGYTFDADEYAFSVQPQVQVGPYHVDFMVLVRGRNGLARIAIECDGHDFHERTKEQAARDRKRDRELQLKGIQVLRFTGSEIWKDPMECFKHVQQAVDTATAEAM